MRPSVSSPRRGSACNRSCEREEAMRHVLSLVFTIALGVTGNSFAARSPKYRVPEIREICNRTLNVGVDDYYPPYLFIDDSAIGSKKKVMGLDVDLIVKIRENLCGIKIDDSNSAETEIRLFQVPFDQLFDRLRQRQFHMIVAGISTGEPLPGREDVIYSYPYLMSGLALASHNGSPEAQAVAELSKKKLDGGVSGFLSDLVKTLGSHRAVVVEKKSKSEKLAKDIGLTPVPSESGDEFEVAKKHGLNLILSDKEVLEYQTGHEATSWHLLSLAQSKDALLLFRGGNSVVVRKNETEVLAEINRVINDLLTDDYIEERRKRWQRYPADRLKARDIQLDVTELSFWDNVDVELKRSKVDFRVQPFNFETINGTAARRLVSFNPALSWLFPVDWPLLSYTKITDVGPQLAYVYKRRKDANALGINREQGWDVTWKFVLSLSPLLSQLRAEEFKFLKPEFSIGAGHRHIDSEYYPGQERPATTSPTVSVLGVATPLLPTFHGLSLKLEYKHASNGARFFGNTVDQTIGLGISYTYPH
jgi:ABC-type amino acid transport substrate-binding protein